MPYSSVREFLGVKTELQLIQYCVKLKNQAMKDLEAEFNQAKKTGTFGADVLDRRLKKMLSSQFPPSIMKKFAAEELNKFHADLYKCIPSGYEIKCMPAVPRSMKEGMKNQFKNVSILTPEGLFEHDGKALKCILTPDELKQTPLHEYMDSAFDWERVANKIVDLDSYTNDELFELDRKAVLKKGHFHSVYPGSRIDLACVQVTDSLQFLVAEAINTRKLSRVRDECIAYFKELANRPASSFVENKKNEIRKILDLSNDDNFSAEARVKKIEALVGEKQFKATIEKSDSAGVFFMKVLHKILNPVFGIQLWKSELDELKKGLDDNTGHGAKLSG